MLCQKAVNPIPVAFVQIAEPSWLQIGFPVTRHSRAELSLPLQIECRSPTEN